MYLLRDRESSAADAAECGGCHKRNVQTRSTYLKQGRYVREGLSNWGRARGENTQRWKRKRRAYIRIDGKGNTDDNGKKEPKRD